MSITIKDGNGVLKQIASQNIAGVENPEHIVTQVPLDPFGLQADAKVLGDVAGSLSAKLRGINTALAAQLPASLGQKVMANSLPVCIASDQTGGSIGALSASENHIGQITKPFAVSAPAITITASSAYTQGFCVGGIISFLNAARVADGTGTIISIILIDANQQNADYTLLLFDSNPSSSTFTDGALALLAPGDFGALLGSIDILNYVSIGGNISPSTARSFARIRSDIPFVLPSGTTIYGVLVLKDSSAPPTYHSTSSLSIRMWVDQN